MRPAPETWAPLGVAPLSFLPFSSGDLATLLLLSGPSDVLLEELCGNIFEVLEYLTQLVLRESLHERGAPKPTVPASLHPDFAVHLERLATTRVLPQIPQCALPYTWTSMSPKPNPRGHQESSLTLYPPHQGTHKSAVQITTPARRRLHKNQVPNPWIKAIYRCLCSSSHCEIGEEANI